MSLPAKSRTRILLRQLISDYGMVFVLLLLMAGFSLLTIQPQRHTGADVGATIADHILAQFGNSARVIIAVPGSDEDRAFADAAYHRLESPEPLSSLQQSVLRSMPGRHCNRPSMTESRLTRSH